VLLDEDIPIRLRFHFPKNVEVETVEYRRWKGLKNGALLRAAQNDFDLFVTTDNNLPDQQPLERFDLAVVILRPRSKRFADLMQLFPELEISLDSVQPGEYLRIHPPE
jgi:hypothetical protein